jgi:hypothetical protein
MERLFDSADPHGTPRERDDIFGVTSSFSGGGATSGLKRKHSPPPVSMSTVLDVNASGVGSLNSSEFI